MSRTAESVASAVTGEGRASLEIRMPSESSSFRVFSESAVIESCGDNRLTVSATITVESRGITCARAEGAVPRLISRMVKSTLLHSNRFFKIILPPGLMNKAQK